MIEIAKEAMGTVNKTKIHASGSTLSYGRRYLLKLIFNLTTVDELDDDGQSRRYLVSLNLLQGI